MSKDVAAGRLNKYNIFAIAGCNQEGTENIQQVASSWAISVFLHHSFSVLVSSSRFRLFCQVLTRFSTLGVCQNVQGLLGWGILNPLQCHSTDSTLDCTCTRDPSSAIFYYSSFVCFGYARKQFA